MIINTSGGRKPKFYTRKGKIATCSFFISFNEHPFIDQNNNLRITYEIKINENISGQLKLNKETNHNFYSHIYLGYFEKVIKMPEIFYKMDDLDYIIKISHFEREKVMIPFILSIEIRNLEKYKILQLKETRKNKLNKIF